MLAIFLIPEAKYLTNKDLCPHIVSRLQELQHGINYYGSLRKVQQIGFKAYYPHKVLGSSEQEGSKLQEYGYKEANVVVVFEGL